MPTRLRKSFGSSRGFRVTLSKSGISTSLGVPGLRVTKGKRGTNLTMGIPGSGIYHTEKLSGPNDDSAPFRRVENAEPTEDKPDRTVLILFLICIAAIVLIVLLNSMI